MTTDLSSKTVKGLRDLPWVEAGRGIKLFVSINAFDELARRLEEAQRTSNAEWETHNEIREDWREAQQKIVAQQARIDQLREALQYENECHGILRGNIKYAPFAPTVDALRVQDDLSALTAHDVETAAKALEEGAAHIIRKYGPNSMKTDRHAAAEELLDKATEYRAKAKG